MEDIVPQPGVPRRAQLVGEIRIVKRGRHRLVGDNDLRQHVVRQPGDAPHIFCHPLDAVEQHPAALLALTAYRQLQMRAVGDNVVLRTGVEGAHRNHTRLPRR